MRRLTPKQAADLEDDLIALEQLDRGVRRAARRLARTVRQLNAGGDRTRSHALPCPDTTCPWHHHQPDRA